MAGSLAKVSLHGAVLDTTVLDAITAEMKGRASKIVQTYGWAIASEAAVRTPKKTHALENSILSESYMLDEMTFRVSDGVEYGVYQEFGTSRMAAHPFLTPAIEAWKERFQNAFADLFK